MLSGFLKIAEHDIDNGTFSDGVVKCINTSNKYAAVASYMYMCTCIYGDDEFVQFVLCINPSQAHTLLHEVLVGYSVHILVGGPFQLGGACCIQ